MRCALLTVNFPPMPSGLGRAAFEIAKALQTVGCEVAVFDGATPEGTEREWDGVHVIGCAVAPRGPAAWLRRRACLGHLVAPAFFRRSLLSAHRRHAFDVVEATNWYGPAALIGRRGPPVVVRNNTPAIDALAATRGARNRIDLWFAHALERRTVCSAAATISNTHGHRARIERDYKLPPTTDHTVIGLALDPATLAAGGAARWPSAEAVPRILFVGRAERRKGFAEALEAFDLVAERRRRAGEVAPILDLVGVGAADVKREGRPLLERGEIVCHAKVDDAQLHRLYAAAAIVLAPSRYESYGLVYREAAAFGRPLIACAEDPAAREFVGGTGCGVLAERCDGATIANAIDVVLHDQALADRMRESGLAAARTLSRETLGRATLAVYERAIARVSR